MNWTWTDKAAQYIWTNLYSRDFGILRTTTNTREVTVDRKKREAYNAATYWMFLHVAFVAGTPEPA